MKTRHQLFTAFLILLFASTVLQAESDTKTEPKTDWYSIEYIVFENNPLSNQALEPWTKQAFQMPVEAFELTPLSRNKAFSPLAIDQQQLHGVVKRLGRLSSYTPIAHGGWIQPLKEKNVLQAIQVVQQAGTLQLEGTITFHRGKYLHLDIDLQLSEMIPSMYNTGAVNNELIQPTAMYRLTETRRIKTSNAHYFDHPRFGVLTIVEKIDSPEAAISTADLIEEKANVNAVEIAQPEHSVPLNEN